MAWSKAAQYHRHGRLQSQHAAGSLAVRTWVCSNPRCECMHRPKDGRCICMSPDCLAGSGKKPVQCHCGWISFDVFDSYSEAVWWLKLRTDERRGTISDLRRQVAFDLLAYGPDGQPARVGKYISDFTYTEDGARVVADVKPKAGTDDLANLKLHMMAAQGMPVKILT